jgi:murein DD-endopeptidase MepM/ murein hydrolase activator NlpD
VRAKPFIFIGLSFLAAALVVISESTWGRNLKSAIETHPPLIEILESPRGIGLAPVKLRFRIRDTGSGLSEVIVRQRQRGDEKIVLNKKLSGQKDAELSLEFPGEESGLLPGRASFEIRAFDRSFWVNRAEKNFSIPVDYTEPYLEVVSSQHNIRHGGSQLVIYRAVDDKISFSGVRVGRHSYKGYSAKFLDEDFKDEHLYAALFSVPLEEDPEKITPRLFAEDLVGNANSADFYHKVLPRKGVVRKRTLDAGFLQGKSNQLFSENQERIERFAQQMGRKFQLDSKFGSDERLIEQFVGLNQELRRLDQFKLNKFLERQQLDRHFGNELGTPLGGISINFSDQVQYSFKGKPAGSRIYEGYEFMARGGKSFEVPASGDGVVMFAEDIGVFGRVVGLSHGLGLSTVYSHLDTYDVSAGQYVKQDDSLGLLGSSGLVQGRRLFFQTYVASTPVDPREWWDKRWIFAHIDGKIENAKRALGIAVYRRYQN